MRVEIHDKDERLELSDLTEIGLHEVIYQCRRLIEDAEEKLQEERDREDAEEEVELCTV